MTEVVRAETDAHDLIDHLDRPSELQWKELA